jgi:predicted amidophosphoribosyltransferase
MFEPRYLCDKCGKDIVAAGEIVNIVSARELFCEESGMSVQEHPEKHLCSVCWQDADVFNLIYKSEEVKP